MKKNDFNMSKSAPSLEEWFAKIKTIEKIDSKHLCEYFHILRKLLKTSWYSTNNFKFTMEVLNEIANIQTKMNAETFVNDFSEITELFGRFLADINCSRKFYSTILKILIGILPPHPNVKQTSIADNMALFTELFDRIRTAGNIVSQVATIELLMLYISDTQLTEEDLTAIVGARIFDNMRQRFTVFDINTHADREDIAILLNNIQPAAERKVVYVPARRAYFENPYLEIQPALVSGVPRDIIVYFNLEWKPSISFFFDISTIEPNNRQEICRNCEILHKYIRDIFITDELPGEGQFTMEINFSRHFKMSANNIDSSAASVAFVFDNAVKPRLFQSKIFEALNIVNFRGYRPAVKEFIGPQGVTNIILIDAKTEHLKQTLAARPSVIQHTDEITKQDIQKRTFDDAAKSSSGPSAKRQRLIAESQNISDVVDSVSPKDTETQQQTSVDEILIISDVVRSVSPKHTDTQAKGYAPEEVTNTAKRRRRDVAKYVMTRSGEFLVSSSLVTKQQMRQKVL